MRLQLNMKRSARRQLQRNPQLKARIERQIAYFQRHPEQFKSKVKSYVDMDGYIWRIGNFRICCYINRTAQGVVVDILDILHRRDANYARLKRIYK